MNSVSWFLYFTDVIRALQAVFGFAVLPLLAIGVVMIITSLRSDEERTYIETKSYSPVYNTKTVFPYQFLRSWGILLCVLSVISCFTAVLIPSRETMYMIAASQVGEQIIQLEEVQELGGEAGNLAKDAISLLRQSIQEQLTEKPVEPSKGD